MFNTNLQTSSLKPQAVQHAQSIINNICFNIQKGMCKKKAEVTALEQLQQAKDISKENVIPDILPALHAEARKQIKIGLISHSLYDFLMSID